MKGKFVKGDVIALTITYFKIEISRLNKLNDSGIDVEQIDYNISKMWKLREAIEYLEGAED